MIRRWALALVVALAPLHAIGQWRASSPTEQAQDATTPCS